MGYPNYYIKQIKDERNSFQFPLWDTYPGGDWYIKDDIIFQFPLWDTDKFNGVFIRAYNLFQFPLWDT